MREKIPETRYAKTFSSFRSLYYRVCVYQIFDMSRSIACIIEPYTRAETRSSYGTWAHFHYVLNEKTNVALFCFKCKFCEISFWRVLSDSFQEERGRRELTFFFFGYDKKKNSALDLKLRVLLMNMSTFAWVAVAYASDFFFKEIVFPKSNLLSL